MECALRHPEAVQALILSNCAGMAVARPQPTEEEQRQMEERRRAQMEALEKGGMEGTFQERLAQVFPPGFPERHPAVVERYRAVYTANSAQEYLKRMRLGFGRTQPPDLSKITCPTFVIVGEHDAWSGAEAGRAMQQAIKGSKLRVFPTGHASALEMPQEYNAAVLEFLAGVTE